jgi:hypothetical protein
MLSLSRRLQKVPVRKPKLLRSNPHHKLALIIDDEDDDIDDSEIAPFFRRPKLVHEPESDEVSDYVAIRLAVIRLKALQKYKETVL